VSVCCTWRLGSGAALKRRSAGATALEIGFSGALSGGLQDAVGRLSLQFALVAAAMAAAILRANAVIYFG
jgi:hypothetical protein